MADSASDLYSDIRSPHLATSRYPQENAVLAAVDEILAAQGVSKTPVAYLGVILMTVQAEGETAPPALSAGMLALLERALSVDVVPRPLLLSKSPQIAASLVGISNAHSENVPVLAAALACAARLLTVAATPPQALGQDALKLFQWMLAFVVHPSAQVRGKGQYVCRTALEECPALSEGAARFIDAQLAAAASRKDVQLALHLLGFLRSALTSLEPGPLTTVANAIMRHPSNGGGSRQHPLLSKATSKVLVALCDSDRAPTGLLRAIMDKPMQPTASPDPGALRAAAAAAAALLSMDASACYARLPMLCMAWVRGLMRQQSEGTSGSSKQASATGSGANADDESESDGALAPSELNELIEACVRPSMAREHAQAMAATLLEALGPLFSSQRKVVLEACAVLITRLAQAASPVCDALLRAIADLYTDPGPGSNRGHVLASLAQAAKAIGPEKFVSLMPIRISTDGGEDTSWLLSALRNSIGNAKLAFFASYFIPLASWLEARSIQMKDDQREVEARNLQNLYEQVWALLPGFCACSPDVAEALPSIAKGLGTTIAERPEVRSHVLLALTLIVQTARSQKQPVVDASGTVVSMGLTPQATAAIATLGRFGKNFLPLLFNVHQAEPPEKRPPLQDAVAAVASATPTETLSELFSVLLRKMLTPGTTTHDSSHAAQLEANRGLMDLLTAMAPSLSETQVGMLSRATRPALLSSDVLLQKKAYKLLAVLSANHTSWVRTELPALRQAMGEALPACASGCKGKRLVCLYAVAEALTASDLAGLLPSLLAEVVLATREVNVKTRAAAYELLVCLAEAVEKRASNTTSKAHASRSFLLMVAGGLAGSTLHMIASSLSALGRLTFELRDRELLQPTFVSLFSTVITLLGHGAQEVVKAALTYIKVGLISLPSEAVRPMLTQLLPAMLLHSATKHPHLKMQVRYVVERLVKRFGYDEIAACTPETHQRLLVHLRKQKVYAHNKAVQRREEKRALRYGQGMGVAASVADLEARQERQAEFEALLDEEAAYGSDEDAEANGRGSSNGWVDTAAAGGIVDMLTAPLVPTGMDLTKRGGGRAAAAAATAAAATAAAYRAATRPAAGAGPADLQEGTVRFDDTGKLIVQEAGDPALTNMGEMEDMDEEDEERARANKRRKAVAAPEDEGADDDDEDALNNGAAAIPRGSSLAAKQAQRKERNKRYVRSAKTEPHSFGAIYGDQFKGKKGAKGDVLRTGSNGMQPFSYMPLAPKLLGKKHQAKAAVAMKRLVGVKTSVAGRKGRHGISKRRGGPSQR